MAIGDARPPSLAGDGFALLPRFAGPAALAVLGGAVAARLDRAGDGACERPHNTLVPLCWDDPVVSLLLGNRQRRARVRSSAAAEDLRWISGYVSLKEARTPPLWWHQDWWCWDHPVSLRARPPQVALLVYLCDTGPENGALRVLPGSHRRSAPIHALLPEPHAEEAGLLDPAHPALADLPGQCTLSLRAGDAVLLDYRLLHGTHANAGATRRDAVLLSFTPSWRGLPGDVRGHLIDHPALPRDDEAATATWQAELLPRHGGPRATLPLNRHAPRTFAIDAPPEAIPA